MFCVVSDVFVGAVGELALGSDFDRRVAVSACHRTQDNGKVVSILSTALNDGFRVFLHPHTHFAGDMIGYSIYHEFENDFDFRSNSENYNPSTF